MLVPFGKRPEVVGALHVQRMVKFLPNLLGLAFLASVASAEQAPKERPKAAPAISADLAKKCRAMAIKAHPTRPAGAKSGHEQAQRRYFQDCIAKGGDVQN